MKLELLDFDDARRTDEGIFTKAALGSTKILDHETDDADLNRGDYLVKRHGSDDAHLATVARIGLAYAGECGCKGYEYNEGPCSHLCAIFRGIEKGIVAPAPTIRPADVLSIDVRDDFDPEQERADQEPAEQIDGLTGERR